MAETRPAVKSQALVEPLAQQHQHVVGLAKGREDGRAAPCLPATQVSNTQILRAPPCPAPTAPLVV